MCCEMGSLIGVMVPSQKRCSSIQECNICVFLAFRAPYGHHNSVAVALHLHTGRIVGPWCLFPPPNSFSNNENLWVSFDCCACGRGWHNYWQHLIAFDIFKFSVVDSHGVLQFHFGLINLRELMQLWVWNCNPVFVSQWQLLFFGVWGPGGPWDPGFHCGIAATVVKFTSPALVSQQQLWSCEVICV